MESKEAESKEEFEAKGGGGEEKGGAGDGPKDGFINVKVQNSDKIVLFEGEVPKGVSLEKVATAYLPEAPEGQQYSLFEVRARLVLWCSLLSTLYIDVNAFRLHGCV